MKVNQKLRKAIRLGLSSALIVGGGAYSINAMSMPSFARQTGWSCATCHTAFPQLTPMGRMFKLLGYTTYNVQRQQKIEAKLGKNTALLLMRLSQLSLFIQGTYTDVAGGQQALNQVGAAGAPMVLQNHSDVELPMQTSIFYAGEITPHIGTFYHLTYGNDGSIAQDDSDVRWAHPWGVGRNKQNLLITGVYVTNTPTEPDPYDSMPNWNAPFMFSDYSGNQVIPVSFLKGAAGAAYPIGGLGAYAAYLWGRDRSNWLYVDAAAYTNVVGTGISVYNGQNKAVNPGYPMGNGRLDGAAPYLRVAFQHDSGFWNSEVGLFGMQAKAYANSAGDGYGGSYGPTDKITDVGIDSQIQWLNTLNNNNLTFLATIIHENRSYIAADGGHGHLLTTNLSATYWYHDKYEAQGGYIGASGTAATNQMTILPSTTATAVNPDTNAYYIQAGYQPWYNFRIAARYLAFSKVLGQTSAGNGVPSASKFNTFSILAWYDY